VEDQRLDLGREQLDEVERGPATTRVRQRARIEARRLGCGDERGRDTGSAQLLLEQVPREVQAEERERDGDADGRADLPKQGQVARGSAEILEVDRVLDD